MDRGVLLGAALLLVLLPVRCGAAEVGDIAFTRKAPGTEDIPPAVFPHGVHLMQYKCYACHDTPFKMEAGADAITMEAISDGKLCGECHNRKTAFAPTFNTCKRCHRQ